MKHEHTFEDGVRMVGQLLLHHPTTGEFARNGRGHMVHFDHGSASCFCYIGACLAVSSILDMHGGSLKCRCDKILVSQGAVLNFNNGVTGNTWDKAPEKTRRQWAQTLADYKETA